VAASNEEKRKGAGGTPGGLLEFFLGVAMVIGGSYLFINQVTVISRPWWIGGYNGFGVALLPLLIGIGILFFNGRSTAGWVLTGAGALIIFLGIITNLDIYFRPTSLFNTLFMLGLIAAGIGLVARALQPHN
jgi:hypothetical protein